MQTHATLYLRLLGFTLLVLALWQGLSNLVESWREFSPTYAIHFLCSELLRPAIAVKVEGILQETIHQFFAHFEVKHIGEKANL